MTVTYVQHIPNSGWWGFYRILFKWRGSLYKVLQESRHRLRLKYFSMSFYRVFGEALGATACSTQESAFSTGNQNIKETFFVHHYHQPAPIGITPSPFTFYYMTHFVYLLLMFTFLRFFLVHDEDIKQAFEKWYL